MPFEYIAFYKPFRVLTQFSPEGDKETLADYLKDISKDIYPVGRLDYDSEGLILLTNDNNLKHQLTDPKFEHKKTYWAQVEGEITEEAIAQLRNGVAINHNGKEYLTKKAIVEKLKGEPNVPERNPPIRFRANIPTSWVAITISEGKNRQVRKMTAAVGFPTLRLIRYSIEQLTIEKLTPGDYIVLNNSINKLLGIKPAKG